jgi:hypothetical protein
LMARNNRIEALSSMIRMVVMLMLRQAGHYVFVDFQKCTTNQVDSDGRYRPHWGERSRV